MPCSEKVDFDKCTTGSERITGVRISTVDQCIDEEIIAHRGIRGQCHDCKPDNTKQLENVVSLQCLSIYQLCISFGMAA